MNFSDLTGSELYFDPSLSRMEKLYCKIVGVPIIGLRIRLRRLSKILPDTANSILDAGCGRGVISRYLARKYPGAKVEAVDSDEVRQQINTAITSEIDLLNVEFISNNLLNFNRKENYDLIVSVDNLEHIEDDQQVLNNFYDSLTESGTLVVHVPHYYRRWPIFHWSVNFDVPGHVRPGYHLSELTERLQRAGFTVVTSGFSYGFLENLINNLSYSITQAEEKNKILYALSFPILNCIAWLGQWQRPGMGAGVWAIARKLDGSPA